MIRGHDWHAGMGSQSQEGHDMRVRELLKALDNVDDEKAVIVIVDGNTLHLDDVHIWSDVSSNPADSPVELVVSL